MKKLTVKQQKQVIELIRREVHKTYIDDEKHWETLGRVKVTVNQLLDLLENGYDEHAPFEAWISFVGD